MLPFFAYLRYHVEGFLIQTLLSKLPNCPCLRGRGCDYHDRDHDRDRAIHQNRALMTQLSYLCYLGR